MQDCIFCTNCGMKLPLQVRFCTRCGTPVAQRDAVTGQPAVQQPHSAAQPQNCPPQAQHYPQQYPPQQQYPQQYPSQPRAVKSWKCNYMPDEFMKSIIATNSFGGRLYFDGSRMWFEYNSLYRNVTKVAKKIGGKSYEWSLTTDEIVGYTEKKYLIGKYLGIETNRNEIFWITSWSNSEIEEVLHQIVYGV